jgi:hypothetical protein
MPKVPNFFYLVVYGQLLHSFPYLLFDLKPLRLDESEGKYPFDFAFKQQFLLALEYRT